MPCARTHSRSTRCESATTGVGAGAAWSTKTATLRVSHTWALPRSLSPVMTASMTESWTMTREIGTITRSPARTSRPDCRDRISSASVLGNDPLPQQTVELVHRERTRVREGLDLLRDVAELVLAEGEAELLGALPDRVVAGEAVGDVHRAGEPEIRRVEDLVAVRIHVDGLGVHPGLVVERVLAGDVLVERDVDLHERRDQLVELLQLRQVVLPFDRRRIVRVHPGDEAAQRRDAVALADAEHARVDVRGPALEDAVAVRDGAAGIVMAMALDVAADVVPQLDRERVALPRRRDA